MVRTEFLPRVQGSADPKNDIDSAYANTFGFVVRNMFSPVQLFGEGYTVLIPISLTINTCLVTSMFGAN